MDFKTAFSKTADICARGEKCCSEIREKLSGWNVDNDIIEKVLVKLVDEKYIDENRFAESYVRDKFRFNKWGRKKITWHLRRKYIDYNIIGSALSVLDESEYGNVLLSLLKNKEKTISGYNSQRKRDALIRFGISRGFEIDDIIKILDRLL